MFITRLSTIFLRDVTKKTLYPDPFTSPPSLPSIPPHHPSPPSLPSIPPTIHLLPPSIPTIPLLHSSPSSFHSIPPLHPSTPSLFSIPPLHHKPSPRQTIRYNYYFLVLMYMYVCLMCLSRRPSRKLIYTVDSGVSHINK